MNALRDSPRILGGHRRYPRVSIRTLLVLTAAIAAVCYWWIARPTILANRFAAAIDGADYAAAQSMIVEYPLLFSYGIKATQPLQMRASLSPRSWGDLWRGQRRMNVQLFEPIHIVPTQSADWSTRTIAEAKGPLQFVASPLRVYWVVQKNLPMFDPG